MCRLSAQLVCVNISCYYPDFSLPWPLLLFIWGLCPSFDTTSAEGETGCSSIRKVGNTDARKSLHALYDKTGPLSTGQEEEPF